MPEKNPGEIIFPADDEPEKLPKPFKDLGYAEAEVAHWKDTLKPYEVLHRLDLATEAEIKGPFRDDLMNFFDKEAIDLHRRGVRPMIQETIVETHEMILPDGRLTHRADIPRQFED